MLEYALPLLSVVVVILLLQPKVRHSPLLRATATPLASIIGSGFLISGPLLTHIAGTLAPLAMLAILLVAFGIGEVIRFNIRHAEPLLTKHGAGAPAGLQRISDMALGLAYMVSVAFYVRLLASFVLRLFELHNDWVENLLTTVVLLLIAAIGYWRGLTGLERAEGTAVIVKLAIIAALLVALFEYDIAFMEGDKSMSSMMSDRPLMERLRLLGGLLLIVQGFETSRYLGSNYNAAMRVRSMRLAQLLAAGIYLLFIVLGLPLLMDYHGVADETVIISLAAEVAAVLPVMIIVAAAMSQFSAAVADTAGAGGLINELSAGRVRTHSGYVLLIGAAVVLVWVANVFEIVTLASRVFALYYLLQCLLAIVVYRREIAAGSALNRHRVILPGLLAVLLAWVVIFAIPVA